MARASSSALLSTFDVILASQSPRRVEILEKTMVEFTQVSSTVSILVHNPSEAKCLLTEFSSSRKTWIKSCFLLPYIFVLRVIQIKHYLRALFVKIFMFRCSSVVLGVH